MTTPHSASPEDLAQPAAQQKPARSRKVRKPRKQRTPKNADGSMSIVEHIQELRRRVMISLAAFIVAAIVGYIWYGTHVGPIPSLSEVLIGPYCSLPAERRFGASDGSCALLATAPFEMLLLRIKVASLAGLVLSSPVWLAQIWGFITPGLKKNERRWAFAVSSAAGFLFILGAILAYFVLAYGLEFLLTIGQDAQIAALNGSEYFGFVIQLLLIFGVSFEVPLLTVLLNAAGVISYKQLHEKRRFIIAFLFVFAAFVTPGQDPYSMVILAVVLCLLMEAATQIARVNDKRRAKKREDWMDMDNDEASSSIDAAAPIGSSGSITDAANRVTASSIDHPDDLRNQFGEPVTATPAPRSSSAARPVQHDTYGRRDGLDLQSSQELTSNPNTTGNSNGNNQNSSNNNGGNAAPGGAGGYFDDVL